MSLGRLFGLAAFALIACEAAGSSSVNDNGGSSGAGGSAGTAGSGGSAANGGSGFDGGLDAGGGTGGFDPDAACAIAKEAAKVEKLPVDIIFVVDNSESMEAATIEVKNGINNFAMQIGSKDLDYKVIMLSLRGKSPVNNGGNNVLYPVCVPQPLAGDSNCGNGAHFFHSSINMLSTQPLEQFLGTLGDTSRYTVGEQRGPETAADANWQAQLRADATRTIVLVSDDNSRLTADQFEHWAGGGNWSTQTLPQGAVLPPGILDSSWNGLFDDYIFSAIYGWGSETDASVTCSYGGSQQDPPASGEVYTDLVKRTGGVRAQICDGASAWGPFFDSVATAVESGAKISCVLDIPEPSSGELDPRKVNVVVSTPDTSNDLFKVGGANDCDASGGWYYDNDANPTQVVLCPTSCADAQAAVQSQGEGSVDIYFGCETRVK
ncbi:MAG: hypothetical protein R3B89_20055 [Polyangiaceae bacterium]